VGEVTVAAKLSRLEQLPCPTCGEYLERAKGPHGLVWLCRNCRAGAVTLPVLRQVAPRAFVNGLWQTALHDGRAARLVCPACTRPFTEFRGSGAEAQIKVCVRCFWVWFSPAVLAFLSTIDEPRQLEAPAATAPRAATPAAARRARRVLGALGAGVLRPVIEKP
jgi:hypothetical protein